MADGAMLQIDLAALDRSTDRMVRRYLAAGTEAVAVTTRTLELRIEAATRAAMPGNLYRAWKSDTYPRRGPARDPVGIVYHGEGKRTAGALAFWTRPGVVRGKSEQYLAVPLPAAGSRGRRRDLTPGEWERQTGIRLRFVYRPGRASLLVADQGRINGRTGSYRSATARQQDKGWTATVPIFVLIPQLAHRNSVAIDPLIDRARRDLPRNYQAAIGAVQQKG